MPSSSASATTDAVDEVIERRAGVADQRGGVSVGHRNSSLLVAALSESADDSRALRLAVAAVLLENKGELLTDELRT